MVNPKLVGCNSLYDTYFRQLSLLQTPHPPHISLQEIPGMGGWAQRGGHGGLAEAVGQGYTNCGLEVDI